MISLIIGIMVSLVVTIVGTPLLIKLVHKLNYGQYIRQDGPKSHLVKRGTPTLGGVVINLAVVLGWCSSALYRFLTRGEVPSWSAVLVLFAMLSMGFLGFIDDFAKVRKKQSEGLTVKGKFIGQFILATIYAVLALILLLIYCLAVREEAKAFLLTFISFYLLYLIYETWFFFSFEVNLKRKKKNKNKNETVA